MNNFFKLAVLLCISIIIVSCSKSDSSSEPLRDFEAQKNTDMENIETFMKSHYMEVVNNPGAADDQDVVFTKIPTGGTQVSIWNSPKETRIVKVTQGGNDIEYTIYYIKLREGEGTRSPCNVDKVYTSYTGKYIYNDTTDGIISKQFEKSVIPSYFSLTDVIAGWGEIFPQFKTGNYVSNPDNTVSYSGFGAGVMFIPSGLAYYSGSKGIIPAYSPLIFNFKLYEIQRMDQDGDGIDSYLEDLDHDGYVKKFAEGVPNPDNTNEAAVQIPGSNPIKYFKKDILPDFLDPDDDGDYYLTKYEIKNPLTGQPYPFEEIPTCGGTGTKKKYLDPTCN